jgi:hypothetical protein
MALHTDLPIHRAGVRLLDLAIKAQVQMPRTVKRALGEKITQHCVDMLDLMVETKMRYTAPVTKVIRDWRPGQHRRSKPRPFTGQRLFFFSHAARMAPFWRAVQGHPRGCAGPVSGTPTLYGLPPLIGVGGDRFTTCHTGAIMADTSYGAPAPERKEQDHRFSGFCYQNWKMDGPPPLIVNPAASLHHKLAWPWGEVSILNDAVWEISTGDNEQLRTFAGFITSRLMPMEAMLHHLGETTQKGDHS